MLSSLPLRKGLFFYSVPQYQHYAFGTLWTIQILRVCNTCCNQLNKAFTF